MKTTKKTFEISLSHKFPTNDVATMRIGTTIDVSESKISDEKLAAQVYSDTIADLQAIIKKDRIAKEIWKGMKATLKRAKDERDAEKELENL